MRINKKMLFLIMLILCFSFSSLAYGQGREVTVEGMAQIRDGDLMHARDMAMNDAFRNAVEQAIGVTIDAQTMTSNYQVIEDSIFSQSRGYVSQYDIIDSWSQGNIFHIKIRAVIKEDILEDDLDNLDLVIHRAGDPRIMVIIPNEEYLQRRWNNSRKISSPEAETAISRKLLEAGFRLIDQNQIDQARDSELIRRAAAGEAAAFHEIGLEYDADLLITGEAISEFTDEIQGFYSYRARLNVQVVNTDTAEIVATNSLSESGVDITESSAAREALAKAGEKMGDYLLDVVPNAISDAERSVQLSISNVSYMDAMNLETELNNIRFITGVYMRDFSASSARFDVQTSLLPNELARELMMNENLSLEVTGISGGMINLRNQ